MGDADAASTPSPDADASVMAEASDAPNGADAADTSVTADSGADAAVPEGGATDAKIEASESGSDAAADAPSEADAQASSDAPIDVSGGTVLLLGAGPSSTVFTGEFHPGASWLASTLTGATGDRPGVALTSSSSGVGVIRSTIGDEGLFTTWTPGRFAALAAVGSGITTSGPPALAASQGHVDLVFQGVDFKHYFARYAAAWNPIAEPIGAGLDQSFGPTPASITTLSGDSVIAYADDARLLADRSRVGGNWQPAHTSDLGDAGAGVAVTPTIVAPTSGPELLIAFVRSPDQDVFFTTRTAGTWATPQAVGGAFAAEPVALVALGGGDVILVLRSVDSHGYWARYSAGVWSDLKGFPWFDITVPATPSIAPGVGGSDAEIAFVDSASGSAMHARLSGSAWGNLVTVGGSGLTSVSIASAP